MSQLHRLRTKLCRALAQSEHAAAVHCAREARRLRTSPPGEALLAISRHARGQRPRLAHLLARRDQRIAAAVGRAVGAMVAALRQVVVDRMFDAERSYRGTLLGLRHGLDVARLLRAVAARAGDVALARFCDELLVERQQLVVAAEQGLAWFAAEPARALASGSRLALQFGR